MTTLSTYWTLWFHKLNDSDWSKASYIKIKEFRTIEEFWEIVHTIKDFMFGMFFLMKEDDFPLWEEKIDGGYWSYKISKATAHDAWIKLCAACIGNVLIKAEPELVCGLSFSPKINNCIIKIFITDAGKNQKQLLSDEIETLSPDSAQFKSFRESVNNS